MSQRLDLERRCPVTGQSGPLRRPKRSHRNLGLRARSALLHRGALGKLLVRVAFGELLDRVAHLQRDSSVRLDRRDGLGQPFRELRVTFKAR